MRNAIYQIRIILFTILLLTPGLMAAQNTWENVPMPGNGLIDHIYLSSENQLFALDISRFGYVKSQSDEAWQAVYPAGEEQFGMVTQIKDTLFSYEWGRTTGYINVYKSTDFGSNWEEIRKDSLFEPYAEIEFFADGRNMYYSQGDSALFLSDNFGESWTQYFENLTDGYLALEGAVSTQTHHYLKTEFESENGYDQKVFRISRSDGSVDTMDYYLSDHYDVKGDTLFTVGALSDDTVYYNTPADQNWHAVEVGGLPDQTEAEAFLEYAGGNLYTKAEFPMDPIRRNGIFHAAPNAAEWDTSYRQLPNEGITDFAANESMMVLAMKSGIQVSKDLDAGWQSLLNGLPPSGSAADFRRIQDRFHLSSEYGTYIYDEEHHWQFTGGGMGFGSGEVLSINDTLYISGGSGELMRQTGFDKDWHVPYENIVEGTTIQFRAAPFYFNKTLFVGGLFGLYGSKDAGETWQDYHYEHQRGWNPVVYRSVIFEDSLLVYAQTRGETFTDKFEGIYVVDPTDTTWTEKNTIKIRSRTEFLGMTTTDNHVFMANDTTIFRLTEDQTGYDTVSVELESGNRITSLMGYGSHIMVGTENNGAYISSNAGETWTPMNSEGIPDNETRFRFTHAERDTVYLIAEEPYGAASSLYYTTIDRIATSVEESAVEAPSRFSLAQNYPNPFNPATQIQFTLPEKANISLAVYDINGRLVETLAEGPYRSGTHTVKWNAQSRASGIYFYRITSELGVKTQKMVLLK